VALTRLPENEGENQDISLETMKAKINLKMKVKIKLSNSAWLAILTCSFSGVFVCLISGFCLLFG